MNSHEEKINSILNPYFLEKVRQIDSENLRFVQYTSAEAAMSIIQNGEVWMRNARCMNDFREVEHGVTCLKAALEGEMRVQLERAIDEIVPGIFQKTLSSIDKWLPSFSVQTYIACVSEHPTSEDFHGRLSMWRAYGGDRPVAIVLNRGPFASETDVFHAYTNPVLYKDPEFFSEEFGKLAERIDQNSDFFKSEVDPAEFSNWLFGLFKNCILCVKHPGFSEGREWRVVYNPRQWESKHVRSEFRAVNGIPQKIHKIPLQNFPKENFTGATIPEFIDKIIIGPNDQQLILTHTFAELLSNAGVEKPYDRICYSGIPLR